jgi:drug/metabolite transporter (DMT)-like permease
MVTLQAARAPSRRPYFLGCGLVLLAGVFWSFGGVTVRLADHADAWQYMIYRAVGQIAAIVLWSRVQGRSPGFGDFARSGPLLWAASCLVAGSAIFYVIALKMTLVANVMLLNATSPLWTAVFAALLLGERFDRATVLAIIVGAAGITIMVQGDFGPGDLLGNALGLLSALCFTFYSICLRVAGTRDRESVVLGFALVALAAALIGTLGQGHSPIIPSTDMLAGFVHGFIFMGVGMMLFVRSAHVVPAAEMTILAQTETIFGPLWVWLAFGEAPLRTTLAGGGLILAAVVLKAVSGVRRPPARVAD